MSRVPLDVDELVEHWTLIGEDLGLVAGKRGATRLGFAVLLRFFCRHGRFPKGRLEIPDEAVQHVGKQVGVAVTELDAYLWVGSTAEYHRAQIRRHLGFRECSVSDGDKLTGWLTENVARAERRFDRVREQLLGHCRSERIEPPTPERVDRMVRSALHQAETALTAEVTAALGEAVTARLLALVEDDAELPAEAGTNRDGGDTSLLASINADPAGVSLETMLSEVAKLEAVRSVGVPAAAFGQIAPQVVAGWRARASVEAPSHLRTHPRQLTVTLLAALLHSREREITDTLVDLLIATVHRINARAEKRVTEELVNAFRRVTGKENILFAIAEAALGAPEEPVRQVVFPAVRGGEQTLRELVHEYKTKGPTYRRTVQVTLKSSYTNHYRRGLIRLLRVLEFRSNNTTFQPVVQALELIARYAEAGNLAYYPIGETVPVHAGIAGDWEHLVYREDTRGRRRVVRTAYEVCTFQALREQLRCKEIWVVGAGRWRNPDEDLPADFEDRRAEHYSALRKPLDPSGFVGELREQLHTELTALNDALPDLPWVQVRDRPSGPVTLSPLDAVPEPPNLRRLTAEVARRWGTVPLIDMLKEAVLRTGCLKEVTSVAERSDMPPEVLAERLLLGIYAYGTNTGIRSVASGGHAHSEDDIRYVRRRYLTPAAASAIAVAIANATFAARDPAVWGSASTTVSSDSTHFRAYDSNIFTEWHSRYGGRGVLVYWHVERKSMVVHSQLLSCSASEVHAMVEGAVRHGTSMSVEGNYVDSHGQSEIGFGITRLLGFQLLPRIKRIGQVKMYRPEAGQAGAYPALAPALTRPIRWDLITQQYDQMIRYATAIRTGAASTEAILRRFTRAASHPTYAAMLEVGRAEKSRFVARYLRDRNLQREITSGLNVGESWHAAHGLLAYGKGGDIASNRRDEQEMMVACLRILQAALVYVNTLMLQHILAEPAWAALLTEEDRRGLTPLFWAHVQPYGKVHLDMHKRLDFEGLPS